MEAGMSDRPSLVMPQLGESIVEGTLVRWCVAVGEAFERGAVLAEVETDKATSEIYAPGPGHITEMVVPEGQTVDVGSVLAWLDGQLARKASLPAASPPAATALNEGIVGARLPTPKLAARPTDAGGGPARSSPAVRRLARKHGVALHQLTGTGAKGRVTKRDVLDHLDKQTEPSALAKPAPTPSGYTAPVYAAGPSDEVEPFSRRRSLIADHMSTSLLTSAHVAAVTEIDMKAALQAKTQDQAHPSAKNTKLTLTAYLVHALARSLAEHPRLNASVVDRTLVLRGERNLGVAVDTPKGLVVPVVRRADELGVLGIARQLQTLVEAAHAGTLRPDDLAGGSFTLSNPGPNGNLFGLSIIRQPEVAILRAGSIVKRAVVRTRDGEDVIVVRPMMYAALSYDHRVIDGAAGNAFLRSLVRRLEGLTPQIAVP